MFFSGKKLFFNVILEKLGFYNLEYSKNIRTFVRQTKNC